MSFRDHDSPVGQLLQRSLQRGRLAHAYLFSGPRGSGKEALARTLAKALNCETREADSCDQCESCRRIDAGTHPDIYWVRPESKSRRIVVDQTREFQRGVSLRATIARVKVGVILDAECMTEEASNAFLKTLEEPPAQTVILLLSAEPQRLLPTILSRCLKLSCGSGADGRESPYRQQVLPLLAEFDARGPEKVRGTYRLLGALTGILAGIREEIRTRLEAAQDLDRYSDLDPHVRERLEDQLAARIEGEYRAAREQVLEELYGWFADVALAGHGARPELLQHTAYAELITRQAGQTEPARALANLEAIESIRESLRRNLTETLALEVGLLKLNTTL